MYYSSFFCNTLIHINYIGVANAIKHTRAIDREAATTNRILTPFVSFDFSWYSSLPASISPPNIITTRKCVLCNVDFIHSRRILFLLPNSANGWARGLLHQCACDEGSQSDSVWLCLSFSVSVSVLVLLLLFLLFGGAVIAFLYSSWRACTVNLCAMYNSLRIDEQRE